MDAQYLCATTRMSELAPARLSAYINLPAVGLGGGSAGVLEIGSGNVRETLYCMFVTHSIQFNSFKLTVMHPRNTHKKHSTNIHVHYFSSVNRKSV